MDGVLRKILSAKIHGATVNEANIEYEGSITIPADILKLSKLLPNEAVSVWNITTGARFETYIISGPPYSREFHVNGAAAHLAATGDRLIIAGFFLLSHEQAIRHNPTVIFMNSDNSVKELRAERPKTVVGFS